VYFNKHGVILVS